MPKIVLITDSSTNHTHNDAKPREHSKLATAKYAAHLVLKIANIDIRVEKVANTEVVIVNPFAVPLLSFSDLCLI